MAESSAQDAVGSQTGAESDVVRELNFEDGRVKVDPDGLHMVPFAGVQSFLVAALLLHSHSFLTLPALRAAAKEDSQVEAKSRWLWWKISPSLELEVCPVRDKSPAIQNPWGKCPLRSCPRLYLCTYA